MLNLTSYSLNHQDEPVLQQLETHLHHLSQDTKAAIAIAALYEATEPAAIYFDYLFDRSDNFDKAIALLQTLSTSGKLAVTRALAEELAVLHQLQGASR